MNDAETDTHEGGSEESSFDWFKAKLSGKAPAPSTAAADEPSDDDEVAPEDEAVEAESDEAADEGRDETEETEQEPESDTLQEYEVEPGKKVKLTAAQYEALKPSMLRQSDYTRKTQELAELRKQSEAQQSHAAQQRAEYQQGLMVLSEFVKAQIAKPDSALLEDDPYEYQRQKLRYEEGIGKLQALQGEMARVQSEQMHAAQAQWQKQQQEELERAAAQLPEMIPEWAKPEVASREKKELASYLLESGYSKDEISAAADPRAIKLSRKAMLYDRMMAKRSKAAPVAPSVARPGPARNPQNTSKAERSRKALARSGRLEDGFEYFNHILNKRS